MYDSVYCARGQAENLIKRHKSQLASDRTSCRSPLASRQPDAPTVSMKLRLAVFPSCRSPLANQMRLILHTAAYWLMRTIREIIPFMQPLAKGEFSTLRLRLLKVAVRIGETGSRIRLAFAANCPERELLRDLLRSLHPHPS